MLTIEHKTATKDSSSWIKREGGGLIAICLFSFVNILFSIHALLPNTSSPQERSATYQACDSAVEQYLNSPIAPQIVLMGSSLVMAPLWSLDASKYTGITDVYHHHRALSLQQLLADSGRPTNIFTFALPGAMMSDFYLIANKLLTGTHTPQLLICGIAPRDFMDDMLTGETKTATFQRLMTLKDLPSLGDKYLSNFQERVDFSLNHLFYLYGKRWRYQDKLANFVKRTYNHMLPSAMASSVMPTNDLEQQFLLNNNRQQVWLKSIEEYRARYRHFNQDQFKKQLFFFNEFLKLCRQREISVLLVNMPLTKANIELMPTGLYQQYLACLTEATKQYKCSLLNLQNGSYQPDDFYDTVHLRASGGQRFVTTLASLLIKHPNKQWPSASNSSSKPNAITNSNKAY